MTLETPDGELYENESWFTRFMRARRNELVALTLIGAGVFILGSALTYDPLDPSLNTAGPGEPQNAFGQWGANGADLVLQWSGWAGAAMGVMLLAWGAIFIARGPRRRGPKIVIIRLVGGAMGVAGMALAASSLPVPNTWPFAVGLGGLIGDGMHAYITNVFAAFGAPGGTAASGIIGLMFGMLGLFACYGVTPADVTDAVETIRRALSRTRRAAQRMGDKYISGLDQDVVRLEPIEGPKHGRGHEHGSYGGYLPSPHEAAARGRPVFDQSGHPVYQTEPVPHAPAQPAPAHPQGYAGPHTDPHAGAQVNAPLHHPAPQPSGSTEVPPMGADGMSIPAGSPFAGPRGAGPFALPPMDLLTCAPEREGAADEETLLEMSDMLETVLLDFGVKGQVVNARPGPVVTLFEFEPAPGVKSSRVINLADDIARSMSAVSARVAVVPGRNVIGIELPNPTRETVYLRSLLATREFDDKKHALPLALGETIGGEPFVADLARMPHLLIAGTTGSGKSVGINAMILSLMYKLPPDRCRFLMIDPKMLELSVYDGVPHLLTPVVTDPRKAVSSLKWVVREMERRYRAMSALGVRNINGYNRRIADAAARGERLERTVQTGFDPETGRPVFENTPLDSEPMPFIVVVIDEMADLMLVAGKEIEAAVQRLAQMARAAGIHLITATQRPSVDVITGTIKANFPTRISFAVTSKIDSRTILGEQGAEQLLGQGDHLYMAAGGRIRRLHGPFVSDEEVEVIANFLKAQGAPQYVDGVTDEVEEETGDLLAGVSGEEGGNAPAATGDELYDEAVAIVTRDRRASTSYLQRRLSIGYNRAATLVERLEAEGVISSANAAGKRTVLAPPPPAPPAMGPSEPDDSGVDVEPPPSSIN